MSTNDPSAPNGTANWTVMVYFAADNELEDAALANLALMKKVGSSPQINILAQLDTRTSGQTCRYHIRDERTLLEEDVIETLPEINTGDPDELTKFISWAMKAGPAEHYMLVLWGHGLNWEDVDSADRAARLSTNPVFKPATEPKRSYSLTPNGEWRVFETGAQPANFPASIANASASFKQLVCQSKADLREEDVEPDAGLLFDLALGEAGGRSQDSLKLRELGCALAKALGSSAPDDCPPSQADQIKQPRQKIHLLGMDACLMGSAEVASQVAPYVDFMVASEDVVPRDSWPYDRILARLQEDPGMCPDELSVWIVREYLIHYRKQAKDVTQAVFNLKDEVVSRFQASLSDLIKHLCEELGAEGEHPEIRRREVMLARMMAQTFYLRAHVDLYDFCQHLQTYTRDSILKQKCQATLDSIFRFEQKTDAQQEIWLPCDDALVLEYGSCGHRVRKARGVSLYFPPVLPSEAYKTSKFNEATNWFDFLNIFAAPFKREAQAAVAAKAAVSRTRPLNGTGEEYKVRDGTTDKVRDGTTDKIPGRPDLTLPKLRKDNYDSAMAKSGTDRCKSKSGAEVRQNNVEQIEQK